MELNTSIVKYMNRQFLKVWKMAPDICTYVLYFACSLYTKWITYEAIFQTLKTKVLKDVSFERRTMLEIEKVRS